MPAKSGKRTKPRHVLVLEDNVHHAELLTEILDRHFAPVIIHTVDTIEDGIEFASQSDYDLVITAGVIREVPLTDAIPKISRAANGVPIVVISGRGDEKLAAEFIKRGAAEYLGKTRETLDNLPSLLQKHLSDSEKVKRRRTKSKKGGGRTPSPAAIIREVDRITQEALTIADPKRRKSRRHVSDPDDLNRLLNKIQHLREMASKLGSK